MSRRIVTVQLQASRAGEKVDTYFDRVVKYIPADIVSAWVFVLASVNASPDNVPKPMVLWVSFACGVVLTALWTRKLTTEPGKPTAVSQIVLSTLAFCVWVIALGGPFTSLEFYRPLYGALLLVLFTLSAGLVVPRE